jgi:hypothetical protein
MIKRLFGILASILFVVILVRWLVSGDQTAHNFAVFLIWFNGAIGVLLWLSVLLDVKVTPRKRSRFSQFFAGASTIAGLALPIGYGQFLLAVVVLFYCVPAHLIVSKADEAYRGKVGPV